MIREVMFFGGSVYILISIAQIIERPALWAEGISVIFVLAIASAYYLIHDKHRLHLSEIVALWAAVLLFLVYTLLKLWGIV